MAIKKLGIALIALLPFSAIADSAAWHIHPNDSHLSFTGKLNGAPTSGEFKTFNGDIHFDPSKLNDSHVKITVDMSSVSTSYAEIMKNLKTTDWLNVALYPQATFSANQFSKTADHTYQANGSLTIKDKVNPVTITFTEEDLAGGMVKITGSTSFKRNQFNIGTGEWADTDSVADEVTVNFVITADNK